MFVYWIAEDFILTKTHYIQKEAEIILHGAILKYMLILCAIINS